MDFKKVLDQTVREIKREVNLKVLKVPEIEQKVLDATDNEPWGPHGSALAEIAQATKKFTECQMVMNVLWTRLRETGKDWRYVYKALAVIEYLVAHGSERAVDDIIEHTFQISSLSSFEYVEPNGKDMGINVRKKAENIVALLNNKDKIQEVRNKAAANRDKYFGLSSTGISHKSSASAFGSSSFGSSGSYGGMSYTREGDRFGNSSKDEDDYFEFKKQNQGSKSENQEYTLRQASTDIGSKHQDKNSLGASKPSTNGDSSNYNSVPSHVTSNNYDDEFDDFDPRGTSKPKAVGASSNQVDLFGESLTGDLLDAPTSSAPSDSSTINNSSEVDLFADASFVSAPPSVESISSSQKQTEVDLFASQPASSTAAPATIDLFASPEPVTKPQDKSVNPVPTTTNVVDPFASVPLNNFDSSDPFGAFSISSNSVTAGPSQSSVGDSSLSESGMSPAGSGPPPKKDSFQVKSGIWADSLSRGIIDLNISAPKKVSLADVGVVGGLSDGSDEREKGPPTSFYMGRAMGVGSGLGKSSFTSSQSTDVGDFFSNFGNQQYQYGSFKK